MCIYVHGFISFVIDLHFLKIFLMFMFIFIYLLVLTLYIYLFQVIGVLSTIILTTFPFQKICTNYHVANIIIFPTGGVHCNTCCSKSTIKKLSFFLWFHCNEWWTCVIDYWKQITWNNCAYDIIWNLRFASSKTNSTLHFNLHSK